MHFGSPLAFLLLIALPAILLLRRRRARRATVRFSSVGQAARTGRSLRQRLLWIPGAARAAALILLVVALARPQRGLERVRDVSKGIAIQMVVDRSGSMGAEMEFRGRQLNRLEAVKEVFRDFVLGSGSELPGRPNDLIGLIAFARYPDTVCPLTLAHGALPAFLDALDVVPERSPENMTAIGDALALAAARLKTAEETLKRQQIDAGRAYEIKSKIVILLTDGVNNWGKRSPEQAAELAAKWGIRVYTIGIGGGTAVNAVQTIFGTFKMPGFSDVDEEMLKAVAKATGGVFRRAQTAKALQDVYAEIDRLERSEIESLRYVDYQEAFAPFALAALAFLAAEVILNCTVFRRAP